MSDSGDIFSDCLEWIDGMTEDERKKLRNPSEMDIQLEHMFLGMAVRNNFLWNKSSEQLQEIEAQLIEKGLASKTSEILFADHLSGPLIKWIRSKA